MPTIAEALATAHNLHLAGKLTDAEQIYLEILATEPANPQAWQLLGMIAHQRGNLDVAVEHLQRAMELQPDQPDIQNNLGVVFQDKGMLDEAFACYRRALAIDPNYAEASYNLGRAFHHQNNLEEAIACYLKVLELGATSPQVYFNLGAAFHLRQHLDDAVACYQRALQLKPDFALAYNNLGNALQDQGKTDDAANAYRQALNLNPDFAEAHNNLGSLFKDQGHWPEAGQCFRRALDLKPDYADAHSNLGIVFDQHGELHESIACFRRALEIQPEFAEALNNLGAVLQKLDRPDEALACCRRALQLKPDHPETHNNLGLFLQEQGKPAEAAACFRRATELRPDYATAHTNHSLLTLLQGDFDRGWSEYEWRWKTGQLPARGYRQPRWNGEPLEGKTILLHAEQGFGDTFQFIRYAPLVKGLGANVVVECQKRLVSLIGQCSGIDQLIGEGEALPAFDFYSPLLSLPNILKTTLSTIPAAVPYLFANPELIEHWRAKLAGIRGFRIGINWRGRTGHGSFRKRDIPLDYFAALAQVPGVRMISLQKCTEQEELAIVGQFPWLYNPGDDVDTAHGAFMDTAAIMKNLDLVITSDTSIPHLAGALAVPVWLALPFTPDWRWLLDRTDSRWYPTMRLFRQKSPNDWSPVFQEIQTSLHQRRSTRA